MGRIQDIYVNMCVYSYVHIHVCTYERYLTVSINMNVQYKDIYKVMYVQMGVKAIYVQPSWINMYVLYDGVFL